MPISLERQILLALDERKLSDARWASKIERLRARLRTCTHSHTDDYEWEHDNGYGRQSRVTGERCVVCMMHRAWKGHGLWSDE